MIEGGGSKSNSSSSAMNTLVPKKRGRPRKNLPKPNAM